jgi:predicted phage baseplate assembly protein
MGLETPRLDDRNFKDLVDEARRRIPLYCPEWTDYNLSDPGITLIEMFAWMTDIVLYRLNRVPDKNFIKLMELVGMRLREAEPAQVPVTMWLSSPQPTDIEIEEGTEVSTVRTETLPEIIFSTDLSVKIFVPKLAHALTSYTGRNGREFRAFSVKKLVGGSESMPAFGSMPPAAGDAFYVGFNEDLSHHILGVEIGVDTAEGAGIDPTNPPYVWEVMGDSDEGWVPVEVDYDATLGLNVNGLVRVHLPRIKKGMRNNVNAYWLRCRLDPSRSLRSYGVTPTITYLKIESWGITVETTNVSRQRNEILGRSTGTPGQKFYTAHTPVVPRMPSEYVIVRHEDGREERWEEVSDFSTSAPTDLHYMFDGNTGEVRFGPALPNRDGTVQLYGAIPQKNAVVAMRQYRYGGGQGGNLGMGALSVMKTSIPYISQVRNRQSSTGGLDRESLEASKARVPGYLRTLNRAVTPADFEYLAEEAAPGQVARVVCVQPPNSNRGEVKLLVIPRIQRMIGQIAPESLAVPIDLRNRISSYLDERRLLGTQLEVLPPAYHWVETEVRFHPSMTANGEEVRKKIEERLYEFINPITGDRDGKGWTFGRDLFMGDIMAVLLQIPGVDFIRHVSLFPVAYNGSQFIRGEAVQQIQVVPTGVVVSYNHEARIE